MSKSRDTVIGIVSFSLLFVVGAGYSSYHQKQITDQRQAANQQAQAELLKAQAELLKAQEVARQAAAEQVAAQQAAAAQVAQEKVREEAAFASNIKTYAPTAAPDPFPRKSDIQAQVFAHCGSGASAHPSATPEMVNGQPAIDVGLFVDGMLCAGRVDLLYQDAVNQWYARNR